MKVAVVAPAGRARLLFEDSDLLDARITQPQPLDSLGIDLTVQRLERHALDEVTDALTVSGQQPRPAEGPWQHVPSEARTAHAAHTSAAATTAPGSDPADTATGSSSPAAGQEAGTSGDADRESGLGIYPALLAASASSTALPTPTPSVLNNPDGPDTPLSLAAEDDQPPISTSPSAPSPTADPGDEAAGSGTGPTPSPNATTASSTPVSGEPAAGVPRIQILGPVTISGVTASRHGAREAQLAALLHLRPGRTADALCAEMDPASPWAPETLNSRLGGLRRSLGADDEGHWYVPRRSVKTDPFTISDKICCDWHHFLRTVESALPHGPSRLEDLEQALDQVRGKPFGPQPLPWSEPLQQEIVMRIVSTAHTVATLRLEAGPHHDLTLARQAIATGLEADDTAELLYRDWFQIEASAGNRSGLSAAISRLDQVNRSLGLATELDTEVLMRKLLDQSGRQV